MEDEHTCPGEKIISKRWNLGGKLSSTPESPGFGTGVSGLERRRLCAEFPDGPEVLPAARVSGYLLPESPTRTNTQTRETNGVNKNFPQRF
jgi:hypothetical protein